MVDARAGPGTKCVNKGKVKPPKRPLKKHRRRHRLGADKRCKMDIGGGALSDDVTGRWAPPRLTSVALYGIWQMGLTYLK